MKTGVCLEVLPYLELDRLPRPPREEGLSPELAHSAQALAIGSVKTLAVT